MTQAITKVEETALTWPEKAMQIHIIDQVSYDLATNTLIEIADIEKLIKQHHAPIKEAAHKAHKAAVAAEKKFLDPLNEAKTIIRNEITDWETEQRRKREEAQRKADEAARKAEEEDRLRRAEEAEKEGKSQEEIEQILDTPGKVDKPIIQPDYIKSDRVGQRRQWKAEITDLKALCAAIGEGVLPTAAVSPNMPFLNAMVRKTKADSKIPGVKAVEESITTIR